MTNARNATTCPICRGALRAGGRHPWLFLCPHCGHWISSLRPEIDTLADRDALDQVCITEGLSPLRRRNYRAILDRVASFMPLAGKRLLDIGCSSGTFLDMAAEAGMQVLGLEPDPTIVARALAAGKQVRQGYFPDAVADSEQFDLITFNDVLEHIPDPRAALNACRRLLSGEGILMINIPSSRGAIFHAANRLDRLGLSRPLLRLWQHGFRSPHLHYFHPAGLAELSGQEGLMEIARMDLRAVSIQGLWKRLRSDRSASAVFCAGVWGGVAVVSPLLRVLPSDITAQFFRRSGAASAQTGGHPPRGAGSAR